MTEPVPLAIAHPVLAELREVGTWSSLRDARSAINPDDVAAAAAALATSDVAFGDLSSAATRPWFRDRVVAAVRDGAPAAFDEFSAAARASLPADLRPHAERIDASVHAFLVTSEMRHLLDAEQAWVTAAAAVDIEALPTALRLGLLCDAAVLHETAWAATRDATRLDRLIGVLELVLSWFRDELDGVPAARLDLDPRLATVTGRLAAARRNAPVHASTARINFQLAYAQRIGPRLTEARTRAEADAVQAERDAQRQSRPSALPGASGATALTSTELVLREKAVEIRDFHKANSAARGTRRGARAAAGYSDRARQAGDRAARQARLGTEREIGGGLPAIKRRNPAMTTRDTQRGKVYAAESLIRRVFDKANQTGCPTLELHGSRITLPVERRFASTDSDSSTTDLRGQIYPSSTGSHASPARENRLIETRRRTHGVRRSVRGGARV